jgi:hypothetical protein
MAEYVLLERTHMSIRDLERMPSERAQLFLAAAEWHARKEAEAVEKAGR